MFSGYKSDGWYGVFKAIVDTIEKKLVGSYIINFSLVSISLEDHRTMMLFFLENKRVVKY